MISAVGMQALEFCLCTGLGGNIWYLMQEDAPDLQHREDAGSNLYETAKLLFNREAAAECISKAEEALAEANFERAVRLC